MIGNDLFWLIGGIPTPLKNDGVFVSWDDEIPNMMGKNIKPCSSHHQFWCLKWQPPIVGRFWTSGKQRKVMVVSVVTSSYSYSLAKKEGVWQALPSGKRLYNYGKSPCLMGKSTISMVIFNSKPLNYQRVTNSKLEQQHTAIPKQFNSPNWNYPAICFKLQILHIIIFCQLSPSCLSWKSTNILKQSLPSGND